MPIDIDFKIVGRMVELADRIKGGIVLLFPTATRLQRSTMILFLLELSVQGESLITND